MLLAMVRLTEGFTAMLTRTMLMVEGSVLGKEGLLAPPFREINSQSYLTESQVILLSLDRSHSAPLAGEVTVMANAADAKARTEASVYCILKLETEVGLELIEEYVLNESC